MRMTGIVAIDNGQEGLYIKEIGIPIEISDSQLTNNTHGLRLTQCNSNITVRSVIGQLNREAVIFSENSDGLLNVTDVTVTGNNTYGLSYIKTDICKPSILSGVYARQLNIMSSEFRETRESGVSVIDNCGMTSVIDNTNFQSNGRGIHASNDHSNNKVAIEKCTFINQTEIAVIINTGGNATIRSNSFTNNRNVCIDIQEKGIAMSLERNVFTGTAIENPLPLYVFDLTTISAVVILRTKAIVTLRHNMFNNPDIQFQLATTVRDRAYSIDARYNYWGSADINDVTSSLYGYHQQSVLANILYHPYLESANEDDYNNASQKYPDVVQGHDIGGIITGQIALYDTHTPYHVTKDIIVNGNGTLLIAEGVTLEFEPGRGVVVMGTLQVQGSSSNEVIMTAKRQIRHPRVRLLDEYEDGQIVSGVIQIYSDTAWRSVCYNTFTKDSTTLAFLCRAVGFEGHTKYNYVYNSSLSINSFPTFQCRSGRFSECVFPADGFTNCSADSVLEIKCQRNFWTGIHIAIDAQPSVIRTARLYQTNHRPTSAPTSASIHVDFLQNHVINNVYIADMFDHKSSRALFVSRVGVDSNSVDSLTVVMRSGTAVESHDSRIHLHELNITCIRQHAGSGVNIEPKQATIAGLRSEMILPFATVTGENISYTKSLFLNVEDRSMPYNSASYVHVTAPEGDRIAAEVVQGSFPSSCSAETVEFHDGPRNESAAVGVTAGLDGTLFRSTGSTVEIVMRRYRGYYGCVNAVLHVYTYKGKALTRRLVYNIVLQFNHSNTHVCKCACLYS